MAVVLLLGRLTPEIPAAQHVHQTLLVPVGLPGKDLGRPLSQRIIHLVSRSLAQRPQISVTVGLSGCKQPLMEASRPSRGNKGSSHAPQRSSLLDCHAKSERDEDDARGALEPAPDVGAGERSMGPMDEVGIERHPDQPDEDVHPGEEGDLGQHGARFVDELGQVGQEEQCWFRFRTVLTSPCTYALRIDGTARGGVDSLSSVVPRRAERSVCTPRNTR